MILARSGPARPRIARSRARSQPCSPSRLRESCKIGLPDEFTQPCSPYRCSAAVVLAFSMRSWQWVTWRCRGMPSSFVAEVARRDDVTRPAAFVGFGVATGVLTLSTRTSRTCRHEHMHTCACMHAHMYRCTFGCSCACMHVGAGVSVCVWPWGLGGYDLAQAFRYCDSARSHVVCRRHIHHCIKRLRTMYDNCP